MAKTIVNTSRRIYWFDENYILREITLVADPFYNVEVLEPVNEGQFRNLYICTNNYRFPKRWDGEALQVSNLGGLDAVNVVRARTMEINNSHVIFGNIAKRGSGAGSSGSIDNVGDIIDTVLTPIDLFGMTVEQGYKRFNKTVIWSDINRPEFYLPELNNQAGDIDYDETGDEIVRIKKLAEFNVVYKEQSIWLLINVGLPFVYVKKFFTDTVGILSVNAVVEADNAHYFIGHDFDIYRFDGVNVVNLSAETRIKDFIIANIDRNFQYTAHAFVDTERKEIQFSFFRVENHLETYREFDVVFNYHKGQFSLKDSIAKCGSYYEETPNNQPINNVNVPINSVATLIDSFLSPPDINSSAEVIDEVHDFINDYKITGVPKWKPIIGDREGFVYSYNKGDSFDGADIDAIFESGDEDFSEPSRGRLADHLKILEQFQLILENQGIQRELEFYIGTRDYFDRQIRWKGPYKYIQNASKTTTLKTRAVGVYHRFRIRSAKKGQYVRILGYRMKVEQHAQLGR